MSEAVAPVAAPAAPAAPVAASVAPPAPVAVGGESAAPVAGQPPRAPDGRFMPRDGSPEPVESAPVETPAQAARRKLNLKVLGEEHALELDDATAATLARVLGTDPARLDVALQKAAAGDRRLKEAHQERERATKLVAMLRADPAAALAQLGVDVDSFALQRLEAAARRESMSPEERALSEREAAVAALEQRHKQAEEQRQQAEQTAEQEAAFQRTQQGVMAALQEHGLPKTHRSIRMVADVMLGAMQAGITLTPAQVAAEVRAEIDGLSADYLGAMPEESLGQRLAPRIQSMPVERLVGLLGPRLRDIMQHTIEQQRARAGVVPTQAPSAPPRQQEDSGPVSPSEAMRRLREQYGGR